ncbi:ABC transporter ATP-binding protein [Paenibacillus sp. HN-1]|uniref:ABC transporter ATP-binding protein n=1 Tax=Paenibacillus TaxID=44249 RepID=UPI001CAA3570|nr:MULTISPECIES: ABC transporter ATP-binding protein [Paenibacillus]MBY9080793.1 ABC transporter ATP-binding protein [Paenibacillus sp. CGMCC 1.18879]MBY9085215.1 ABC transporter ATP-binding protein [Paenibacillus sinensis]
MAQTRLKESGKNAPDPSRRSGAAGTRSERSQALGILLSYAKPERASLLGVAGCSLFAISADLLQPLLMKFAIDERVLFGRHGLRTLLLLAAAYLLLAAVSVLFAYLQANLLQRTGQTIVARLRGDLFRHITDQSMSFFDRNASGSLVTNESSDTETINQFFTQVLLSLIRDTMSLVLIIGFMFALDARLALYCLLLLPLIAAIAIAFRAYLRRTYQESRSRLSRLIAFTAENLSGMSLIQAFHQEKEQTRRFTEYNGGYLAANLREVRGSVLFNRSFDILGNLSVAFVVWIGGIAVLKGRVEFGVLYAFISYIRQFFQPINQITQQWNTLQSTLVSVDRLQRIFAMESEVQDPEPSQSVSLTKGSIQGQVDFNNISFSYTKGQEVLHGLDLHIRPGEFIGIVGTTGAGKSSLVNLLTRFYDVNEGSIRIDGADIRLLPQEKLHRIVGLVQQEPYLYSGTIVDNVRMFREEVSREEVIRACRRVGAHSRIERLRGGYDTRLSDKGSGLSAGERQLISFARILVMQPKILILDEATAHLDSHTERLIQRALDVVSEGRTTLVIAHRLSTVQHASRILVMRDGVIAEEGDHASLMALGGYYAELVRHSRQGSAETQAAAGGEPNSWRR